MRLISRSVMLLIFAVVVMGLGSSPVRAQCNGVDAEEGIKWCKMQCDVTHSNAPCDASGRIASYARNMDVLGVRNAFGDCQSGNDDDKIKQRTNVEQCFLHNQRELLVRACNVYGGCAWLNPPPPPPPPPPTVKDFQFNQAMHPATDDKQIIIADLTFEGQGQFKVITLDFRRDDVRLFSLSTYAVGFSIENGRIQVKITTYDKSVPDVSRHKYTVAGTLSVVVP